MENPSGRAFVIRHSSFPNSGLRFPLSAFHFTMSAMSFASLADFLESLAAAGELARVAAEVEPGLEIAQISTRVAQAGGPALLFERVRGQRAVVVTNLFGGESRICRALGIDALDDLHDRGEQLADAARNPNWLDRLKGSEAGGLEKFAPKRVKQAPCQQVVRLGGDVDLAALPAMKSWPDESAPAITGGQLTAVDEPSGRRIWQSCLLPVVERNRLALPLAPFDPLAPAWEEAQRRRQKLPVALVLGGNPLAMLLAAVPEVVSADPFALAGFWSGEAVQVAPCRTQPLEVPAAAEIVLEGVLDPRAGQVDAGQFVVPSGFYRPLSGCLNLEITAITQRTNAAFPAVIHGPPPSEATALDQLAERMLLPLARRAAPEVADLAIPPHGGRHDYLYVSIRKRYARQAHKVAGALWGLEGLMLTKTFVLVDAAVDVHNTSAVLREIGANVLPGRDVFFADGPAHPFDRAGAAPRAAKLGIDATSKLPGEGAPHWPSAAAPDPGIEKLLQSRWEEYGLDLPPPG